MSWGFKGQVSPATRTPSAADRYFGWFGLHMSLSVKLFLPVVFTTVLLAGGLGIVVSNLVIDQLRAGYGQAAAVAADGIEALYVEHPDVQTINEYLVRLQAEEPEFESIRVHSTDSDGRVIASSKPSDVGKSGLLDETELRAVLADQSIVNRSDGTYLDFVRPLRDNGRVFAAVVIESAPGALDGAQRSIILTIGEAAVIAILVESTFVLSALYFGIIRRTRRMQRAVEAVGRGDMSIRLPEGASPRGKDEIFNLARSVDLMIGRLDGRHRFDSLIRGLGRQALQGTPAPALITEAMNATRDALGLEACILARITEDGVIAAWRDGASTEHAAGTLPIWVSALTVVAIEARAPLLTNRLGQASRLADAPGVRTESEAAIVPLPRTSKAGQAIIAIAHQGGTIPDGGLAVIEAVAATIAETLHMQAAEDARAESAVKSKVMAAVSHEMRNPLNSILGFTGLVLNASNQTLTEKQRRQLGHVQTSATTMLTLVNNYLDLAKMRAGSTPLQVETVNLSSLISEVIASQQPQADAKNITVRSSVSGGSVRIDPFLTRQVLNNLISNAVKFTPAGGHVYVRGRAGDQSCRIAVSDDGVGIPKAQQGLVFTEFAKIDADSMAGGKGTGLGLTLTRAYAEKMGGTIRFHSRRGRGTTFVVLLPSVAQEKAVAA